MIVDSKNDLNVYRQDVDMDTPTQASDAGSSCCAAPAGGTRAPAQRRTVGGFEHIDFNDFAGKCGGDPVSEQDVAEGLIQLRSFVQDIRN